MIRELFEETGIHLSESKLIRCGRHYLSAGIMTEATTCFIAFVSIEDKDFPYAVNNATESEFLEVDKIPLSDIIGEDNKQASLTICALYAEKKLAKMK